MILDMALQLKAGIAQSVEQAAEPALRREVACYDPQE